MEVSMEAYGMLYQADTFFSIARCRLKPLDFTFGRLHHQVITDTWQGLTGLYDKRQKGADGGEYGDKAGQVAAAGQFVAPCNLHPDRCLDDHQCLVWGGTVQAILASVHRGQEASCLLVVSG